MKGLRIGVGEHGEVQYARKPNGRYVARVLLRDQSGQVRRIYMSVSSKSAARRRLMEAFATEVRSVRGGEYTSRTTFSEVAEDWFRENSDLVESGQRSPSTLG